MQASFVPHLFVECPKCGKHSIVNQKGTYQCLNCDFKKAFNAPPAKGPKNTPDNFLPMLLGIFTFVVVLMIFS